MVKGANINACNFLGFVQIVSTEIFSPKSGKNWVVSSQNTHHGGENFVGASTLRDLLCFIAARRTSQSPQRFNTRAQEDSGVPTRCQSDAIVRGEVAMVRKPSLPSSSTLQFLPIPL